MKFDSDCVSSCQPLKMTGNSYDVFFGREIDEVGCFRGLGSEILDEMRGMRTFPWWVHHVDEDRTVY